MNNTHKYLPSTTSNDHLEAQLSNITRGTGAVPRIPKNEGPTLQLQDHRQYQPSAPLPNLGQSLAEISKTEEGVKNTKKELSDI